MQTITRSKGGTAEREVPVNEIQIPDLWHYSDGSHMPTREEILECWHLCHDLLNAIREG